MNCGHGLKEDEVQGLSINLNEDFSWKGKHAFNHPVILSPKQSIDVSLLHSSSASKGAMIAYDGQQWVPINPSEIGKALVINNQNMPAWGSFDLSQSSGILSPNQGGTGLSLPLGVGLIIANRKSFEVLAPGVEGDSLTCTANGGFKWSQMSIQGIGQTGKIPLWSSDKIITHTDISYLDGVLILGDHRTIQFGTQVENQTIKANHQSLLLQSRDILLSISGDNALAVRSIDAMGVQKDLMTLDASGMLSAKIQASSLAGVLGVPQGGLGISQYRAGDIVFASNSSTLSTLSMPSDHSFILGIVDGKPAWRPEKKGSKAKEAKVTKKNASGELDFDGAALYVTMPSGAKKQLAFFDGDITGSAAKVSSVVDVHYGGTGADLRDLPVGSLIYKSSTHSFGGITQGSEGQVLTHNGQGNIPSWVDTLNSIASLKGLGVTVNIDKGAASVGIDASSDFNPTWGGKHEFTQKVYASSMHLTSQNDASLILAPSLVRESVEGSIWYDGIRFMGHTKDGAKPLSSVNKPNVIEHLIQYQGSFNSKAVIPMPHRAFVDQAKWVIKRVDLIVQASDFNQKVELLCHKEPVSDRGFVIEKSSAPNVTMLSLKSFTGKAFQSGDLLELVSLPSNYEYMLHVLVVSTED